MSECYTHATAMLCTFVVDQARISVHHTNVCMYQDSICSTSKERFVMMTFGGKATIQTPCSAIATRSTAGLHGLAYMCTDKMQ